MGDKKFRSKAAEEAHQARQREIDASEKAEADRLARREARGDRGTQDIRNKYRPEEGTMSADHSKGSPARELRSETARRLMEERDSQKERGRSAQERADARLTDMQAARADAKGGERETSLERDSREFAEAAHKSKKASPALGDDWVLVDAPNKFRSSSAGDVGATTKGAGWDGMHTKSRSDSEAKVAPKKESWADWAERQGKKIGLIEDMPAESQKGPRGPGHK